nr:uncharacterized protein LOC132420882 [Delphinus delphis]
MFTPWGGSFSGLLREDQGTPVHRPSINLLRFASASDSCCFLGESKLLGDREGLTFGGSSGIPLAPDHENIGSWRYQPTWDDCQQLLQTLLTTEERQRVLLEAKKNVLGANGQPTQLPNEIDAGFPLVRPNWDFNAPEGYWDSNWSKRRYGPNSPRPTNREHREKLIFSKSETPYTSIGIEPRHWNLDGKDHTPSSSPPQRP